MKNQMELVARSRTLEDVVEATRQYLARWSPDNLAFIPRKCRPHWIGNADDIEYYAGKLQNEFSGRAAADLQIPGQLETMRDFFAGAACVISLIRLSEGDAETTLPRVMHAANRNLMNIPGRS